MRYPINFISISQGYHTGKSLDFGYWNDSHRYQPVYAADNATVYSVENQPKGGKVVYLKHEDGKVSCYAHLDTITVKKNDKVSIGTQIGTMGSTGKVTGMHLHFALYSKVSIRYKNADLDPFEYLEVYDNQEVRDKALKEYGSKIKYHKSYEIKYVTATDGLNVRSGAGTKYKVVRTLSYQDLVNVYEVTNGWARIGDNEYCSNNYLSSSKPTSYEIKTATARLRIRTKPSLFSKCIGYVNKGEKVTVYKKSGSWVKIAQSEDKWVSNNYLK